MGKPIKNQNKKEAGQDEQHEPQPDETTVHEEQAEEEKTEAKVIANDVLKIITCNVASLNSACKKGFLEYLKVDSPDIICVQETKLHSGKPFDTYVLDGYYGYFFNSEIKKGYSGTAIYTNIQPISVKPAFKDDEGRVILMEFSNFYLVNSYVPMAGMNLERLDYKIDTWNPKLENLMNDLCKTKPAILCGDLNVAHQPLDIYDTKGKDKVAGYTPRERKWFDDFIKQGYVDVFRHLYPKKQQFSFYSYRFNAKAKGHGWRLDYFVMPQSAVDNNFIEDCLILSQNFSDHSPVVLLLNKDKVLTGNDKPVSESGITILNSNKIISSKNSLNSGKPAETEDNEVSAETENKEEPQDGDEILKEEKKRKPKTPVKVRKQQKKSTNKKDDESNDDDDDPSDDNDPSVDNEPSDKNDEEFEDVKKKTTKKRQPPRRRNPKRKTKK